MADKGGKGEKKVQIFEYLKNKKSVCGKLKSIFNNF